MNKKYVAVIVGVVIVAVVAGFLAYSFTAPLIEVHDVEMRMGVGSAAVFLTIHNHGLLQDCLTGVRVHHPEGIKAELHKSIMDEKGVMKMERVNSICVGGLGEVRLGGVEAGQYHIMIIGDTEHMDKLEIELLFQSGRTIPIEITAEGAGEHTH